jgi:glycosyltransferase involved in cell wall biosynthesis
MDLLHQDIRDFVSGAEIVLFTAVARLDYFKNAELLIEVGIELLNRGLPVKILVVGDPENENSRRYNLLSMVPVELQSHFLVIPRLPKNHLYALFSTLQCNGIFLCPSRYETLGITPLEAAASGVATLITDSNRVEAAAYLPGCCCIAPNAAEIAAKVQMIFLEGLPRWADMVKNHVRPSTSLAVFRYDLLKAWGDMSRTTTRRPIVIDSKSSTSQAWRSFISVFGTATYLQTIYF